MYKGLLFMGAGAVLHATHERNMRAHGRPDQGNAWTSALFLVGCMSISGLPPFNGFVSEGLTSRPSCCSGAGEPAPEPAHPLGAALLALSGADRRGGLRQGLWHTFLGHRRSHQHTHLFEVNWPMRIGMLLPRSCALHSAFSRPT